MELMKKNLLNKRHLTAYLILFITGLLVAPVRSGVIEGIVSDAKTKEPLIGVNVVVMDTQMGASTDEMGRFRIENIPTGSHRLQFSYIGYLDEVKTDIVVRNSRPVILNTELMQQSLEGEGVTVTAGYFTEEKQTQPSIIGLSREEIRRFPGGFEDVVRTVSTLPGVTINNGGGRNDLLVRGGGPSENLYIVNNIEVPNINHFGTQGFGGGSLSFINLDFVDNVTFSSGGFGARYGDKLSSVLELTMAEGRSDHIGGKLLVSASQYGMNLEGPLGKKGNFIFSARQSYLDLIFKAAGLAFVPVYTDLNFLAHYNPSSRDQFVILGLGAIDRVSRDLGTPEKRVQNASLMDNTQYLWTGGINYRRIMQKGYMDITLGSNLFHYRFSQADNQEQKYFDSRADENEYSLKIQQFRGITDNFSIFLGASTKFLRNNNLTVFADTIYDRNGRKIPVSQAGIRPVNAVNTGAGKYAAFVETDWQAHPKFNINMGLRASYYGFIDSPLYLAPRLALKYRLTSRHTFKLSGGIYYQSPSYVWVVNPVNERLKALRNSMAVLGWDYLIRDDFRLSLEGYYKKYDHLPTGTLAGKTDYIVLTNTGTGFGGREDEFQSFGYFPMVSAATGKAYGAELLLQKKFSEIPCYGLVSFSYGRSEYTAGNGRRYPGQFDQRFIFNLTGGYKFNSKWEVSGKFRYFTGIPYTPVYLPSQNPVNQGFIQNLPEEYLAKRLNPAHHLDLRVDRYFNFQSWTMILFLDIQNIYNFRLPIQPSYDFWNNEIVRTNSIGILPSIGFSAEF